MVVIYRALLLLGALAAVAYPAADLVTGRGLQWPNWIQVEEVMLAFYLVGAFAFARRPDHPVARRMVVTGSGLLIGATIAQLLSVTTVTAGTQPWFWLVNALEQGSEIAGLAGFVAVLASFPDGEYERGYERSIVRACAVLPLLIPVLLLLTVSPVPINTSFVWAQPVITSPIYVPALSGLSGPATGLYQGRLALLVIGTALLVLRYRRSDPARRAPARWPLFALFFVVPLGLGPVGCLAAFWGLLPACPNGPVVVMAAIVGPTLPIALAIGFLRPRLLDIDLVIRRSVVYALLWLIIVLAYVGLAAAIGVATAQRYEIGLALALTIVATLVFQPARTALERLASRVAYGERLSEYDALSHLGSGLEEADAERAASLLAETARRALDATWARVVISGEQPITAIAAASSTSPAAPELAVPLAYGESISGRLECGPRSEGRYRERDRELLMTLARQAGLAIHNAQLARELRDSRARIVRAEELGRRRLERDIHDGVQQELVALLAKLRLARDQLGRDPTALAELLEDVHEETRLAIRDLRAVAQGIHPAVLSDRGLVDAIEERVARMPNSVAIDATPAMRTRRFPPAIEGAAYFTVCEALSNAMKHAAADHLVVRLAAEDSELSVDVADDGSGFDTRTVARSGLSGLADRIEALGGRLQVTSAPGNGTRLVVRLPVPSVPLV
jgi:signal transduction histidine kinase